MFHAVDQMSAWSPFSHPQYAAWRPYATAELLARQRELRARRGWGGGLEAVFYVDAPNAAAAAARAPSSLANDAREEASILDAMRPRLAPYLGEASARRGRELHEALLGERDAFAGLTDAWLAVLDVVPPPTPIPMVFVASPGAGVGGGGSNGGVVVIEIPAEGAVRGTLTTVAHELAHALAAPRQDAIASAAKRCGLDATTMGEALAYAIAPGGFAYDAGIGGLERTAARNGSDTAYGRFARLAIAIRPAMTAALEATRSGKRGQLDELLADICRAAENP